MSSFKSQLATPLAGVHIIISGLDGPIDYTPIRNSSGYIVGLKGVAAHMLPWLSAYYNFTYSPLQIKTTPLDAVGNQPGLINLLYDGKCDAVATVTTTFSRAALVDFTHASIYIPITYLIPMPGTFVNVFAIIQPFQFWAWIGVLVATVSVLLFFYMLTWFSLPAAGKMDARASTKRAAFERKMELVTNYVLSYVLLKREGYNPLRERAPMLLVAGTWGIGIFLLANYYTSLLTSHVTAPNHRPLINSIFDLDRRTDVRLVLDKNLNIDTILSTAESGYYKVLGDRLNANPQSRCLKSKDCVNMVLESGDTVYLSGKESYLYRAILEDLNATRKCNLFLGRDNLMEIPLGWALRKKSPYIQPFNMGFMRMREAGLLYYWYKLGTPDVRRCVQTKSDDTENVDLLTLRGFTAAAVVFGIGTLISIGIFFIEILCTRYCKSGRI